MTSLNEWIDKKIKDGEIDYIGYSEFSKVKKIGNGSFGIVESADWKSCAIKAALKTLINNPSVDEDNLNEFVKEVILFLIVYFKLIYSKIFMILK